MQADPYTTEGLHSTYYYVRVVSRLKVEFYLIGQRPVENIHFNKMCRRMTRSTPYDRIKTI